MKVIFLMLKFLHNFYYCSTFNWNFFIGCVNQISHLLLTFWVVYYYIILPLFLCFIFIYLYHYHCNISFVYYSILPLFLPLSKLYIIIKEMLNLFIIFLNSFYFYLLNNNNNWFNKRLLFLGCIPENLMYNILNGRLLVIF